MNKILVVLFTGFAVATAVNPNPYFPALKLFKEKEFPTVLEVHKAIQECMEIISELFKNQTMKLPDTSITFVDKDGKLVEVVMTNGQLSGLDSIYKNHISKLCSDEDYVHLVIKYKFEKLTATYHYAANIDGARSEGQVVSELTDFGIYLYILIERKTMKASNYNFKATNLPIDIVLLGNSTDKLTTTRLMNNRARIFKESIEDAIVDTLNRMDSDLAKDYNFQINNKKLRISVNVTLN